VLQPLIYQSDVARTTYTVPTDFETDFASVPRIPGIFDLFGDSAHEAAVLHDWLYTSPAKAPRFLADEVLLEAMQVSGIPWWRRYPIYLAVRLFGEPFFLKGSPP